MSTQDEFLSQMKTPESEARVHAQELVEGVFLAASLEALLHAPRAGPQQRERRRAGFAGRPLPRSCALGFLAGTVVVAVVVELRAVAASARRVSCCHLCVHTKSSMILSKSHAFLFHESIFRKQMTQ